MKQSQIEATKRWGGGGGPWNEKHVDSVISECTTFFYLYLSFVSTQFTLLSQSDLFRLSAVMRIVSVLFSDTIRPNHSHARTMTVIILARPACEPETMPLASVSSTFHGCC